MKGRIGPGSHSIGGYSVLLAGRMPIRKPPEKADPKFWTAEEIETLRKGYDSGWSFGQISRTLKRGRSAVAGKLHRLGLLKGRGVPTLNGVPDALNKGLGFGDTGMIAAKAKHQSPYAAVKYHCEPLTGSEPIDLLELQLRHCRWIVTHDGAQKFCGLDKAPTGSFCPQHHKFAYVKEPPRPHRAINKEIRR